MSKKEIRVTKKHQIEEALYRYVNTRQLGNKWTHLSKKKILLTFTNLTSQKYREHVMSCLNKCL